MLLVGSAAGRGPELRRPSWGWGGRELKPLWAHLKSPPRLTWLGWDSQCTETHFRVLPAERHPNDSLVWYAPWRQDETSCRRREDFLCCKRSLENTQVMVFPDFKIWFLCGIIWTLTISLSRTPPTITLWACFKNSPSLIGKAPWGYNN